MSKLSKLLFGTAIAGIAVAGTVAYLKKQENSDTKDELKDFKEHPEFEDEFDDSLEDDFDDCGFEDDCCYSHKEDYKVIAAETFDDVRDIVVDTARSLSNVAKDAYSKVKDLKENVAYEEASFFEDLEDEFEEFDEVLNEAKEETKEKITEFKSDVINVLPKAEDDETI